MKPHHSKAAGPSQRQLRVGEQVRHILAQTMQRGHFTHESLLDAGRITVTDVKISPDLKNAKAYVVILGGDPAQETIRALNEEAHIFQREISHQANLKFTPKIRFVEDESLDQANRIDEILRDIRSSDPHEN